MKVIYGVVLNAQEELINELCFKKCGKILIGGLQDVDNSLSCLPCNIEKCLYEENTMEYGTANNGEYMLILRKIKQPQERE
jgi:hypothetical protein